MCSSGIEVIGHGVVRRALECDLVASFHTSSGLTGITPMKNLLGAVMRLV